MSEKYSKIESGDKEVNPELPAVSNPTSSSGQTAVEIGSPSPSPDSRTLSMVDAVNQIMPFGKFKGELLLDLPEPYVVWFKQQGFPKGKLGQQMALIFEIKANGLEKLIRPLLVDSDSDKPPEP